MLRSATAREIETHLRELLRSEPVYARLITLQVVPSDCIVGAWLAKVEVRDVTEDDRRVIEAAVTHLRRSIPCLQRPHSDA
ncbi:MAG: hypothetical protein K8F92_04520 [Hyphomicrobium sp.]|uniref:hypothetical protein n=1 Tax=Hyphomicrobium sp. TaxID=82 RepID=UPI0013237EB3|nr:hypothetical protein [Hyphomicrobium sp.]KAB2943632.1 MAG: hypothetical protein F9K20_02970 [Hyphomicrobium sp.]MBZ0208903.1 hypothetical protein [Hyphomicrobium sp.]